MKTSVLHFLDRQLNCKWMPLTLFPRPRVKPGDVADCTLLISSLQQAPGKKHCKRWMRNPVVIVFCVCSLANMEHVAAVREPGGLQRLVQSCQIRFRPLTACGSWRKAWRKWNHSICAKREGSTHHWSRIWSRAGEWSYLIHAHALFTRLTGAQMCLILTPLSGIPDRLPNLLFKREGWLVHYLEGCFLLFNP